MSTKPTYSYEELFLELPQLPPPSPTGKVENPDMDEGKATFEVDLSIQKYEISIS